MKFGKALARELPRGDAWRPHALAYKQLKRLLKPCAGLSRRDKLRDASLSASRAGRPLDAASRSDAALRASRSENAFFAALRDEVDKVNRFFLAQQRVCAKRLQLLEDDIRRATRTAMLLRRSPTASRDGVSDSDAWLRRAGAAYAELLALESFCVLNFCAVSKILKKHDKWTAFRTRARFERAVLVRQPFATYVPLLQMMRRVEAIALGISIVALTEKWAPVAAAGPLSIEAGYYAGDSGLPDFEPKLPPLRIAIAASLEHDSNGTDSEDITPRYDADEEFGYFNNDHESVDSDLEDQPSRQRRRRE